MRVIADLHCHTAHSIHALSPLEECVRAAAKKGLRFLAITDHGNGIGVGNAPNNSYFKRVAEELCDEPIIMDEVRLLGGVESNILNHDGEVDIPSHILRKLHIVIASLHKECIPPNGKDTLYTEACIKALKNPHIDILGHPDDPRYKIKIDEVVDAAAKYGKVIELNNNSPKSRPGSEEITYQLAEAAKKFRAFVSLGSDAHFSLKVGNLDHVVDIAEKAGISESYILNCSAKNIFAFLAAKRNRPGI